MRLNPQKVIAALFGAALVATPATAWADDGKPGQKYCATYEQVASNSTGGSYVGGILMYEEMAPFTIQGSSTTTTITMSSTGQAGVPGVASASGTTTTTVSTTTHEPTVVETHPVGYYAMNDGSVYRIDCFSGDSRKL